MNLQKLRTLLLLIFFLWIAVDLTGANPLDSHLLPVGYFQQEVNYKIKVTLNDSLHELNAWEEVQYKNNSPFPLQKIYFHLWPNAYSSNNTALARQLLATNGKMKLFKDPRLRGYIDSLDFRVEGKKINWHLLPDSVDICILELPQPLLPGNAIRISTPFHVKLPQGITSRMGHIEQSYQISQWYPKPAVFDQKGWYPLNYLDQGEFYSEFGSFDVSITLPSNYVVGATGVLQNKDEEEFLTTLSKDTSWRSVTNKKPPFPPSAKTFKTLTYKEKNIHDFAWFADKRFHVLKGEVKLPGSGKIIPTMALFTDEQAFLWKEAISYINNAIDYFSKLVGDYPYSGFTAVQSALSAGSGMEYPEITVIGVEKDAYSLDQVIAHEIAHNWFYGALGFNERRYPFLDEGITSAYEIRYTTHFYPGKKLWEEYFKNYRIAKFFHLDKIPIQRENELEWLIQARTNTEQPINSSSTQFSVINYDRMIYIKAPMAYNYLRAYLGDSLFDSIMHEFYERNKFTHPQPDDLREIFETETHKDISWFFDDLIGTTKRLDYKVKQLAYDHLLIKNKAGLNSPLVIAEMKGDSVLKEQWVDGFTGEKRVNLPVSDYSLVKIDPHHVMPELYRLNDEIRRSGIFRKAGPYRTQFYFTIEDPDKSTIMYFPALNWTRENGFMLGMAFYNGLFLPKPFEYFLMPFYGFNSSFAGYGKITYSIIPYNRFYRMASFTLEATQFGAPGNQNFDKVKTGIDLFLATDESDDPLRQKIYSYYTTASDLQKIILLQKTSLKSYLQTGYFAQKNRLINPYNFQVNFELGDSYLKTSLLSNYRVSYYGSNRGLDFRFFFGKMIFNHSATPFYRLAPSGRSGREDYLFQGTFPDRFVEFPKNFWSRQFSFTEGLLVSPVNQYLGYSDWLLSLSMTSNLPDGLSRVPIKPFVNLLFNDHGLSSSYDSRLFYEAGLKAGVWDFFEVYLPLLVSDNISSVTGGIKNRIRFIFKLDTVFQIRKIGL